MPRKDVINVLASIRRIRGLTVLNTIDTDVACDLFTKHNVPLADCLIATQIKNDMKLVTYDKDFKKLKISCIDPKHVHSS